MILGKWRTNLKKKIYIGVLIISLLATSVLLYGRIKVESQTKSVEIIADYEEFAIMAEQQSLDEVELFKTLNEAGIRSVALKEETLYSMVEEGKPLEYDLFKTIQENIDWSSLYGPKAVAYLSSEKASQYDVVVRTNDEAVFEFLKAGITARYEESFYQFFDESVYTVVLKGAIDDIYYTEDTRYKDSLTKGVKAPRTYVSSVIEDIGLGYDPEKIETIQSSGMAVNLRPNNFYKYNSKLVDAYFNEVDRLGEVPSTIIFNGREIMSYTKETGNYQQALYDVLKERNIPVGMIEAADQLGFTDQKGVEDIAEDLEYNVVRVFPVIEYIQQRYNYLGYYEGGKEIENTLYRAITERNIRAIYFRPFKDTKFTYYTDLNEYKKTFEGLSERLASHGISLGTPSVTPYNQVSPYLLALTSLGLLVLGLIILRLLFDMNEKFEWVLFVLGSIGVVGINFVAPNLSLKLFSFAAANIFGTIAVIFTIEYLKDLLLSTKVFTWKGILVKNYLGICLITLVCMLGGLYVAAIMSRADYLVEMNFFRGVKVSLLLPMALSVLIYLIKFGYKRNVHELEENTYFMDDIKRILVEDVKMYYALIVGALGVVFYVYIARSGHDTNIEVLNVELIFRNYLEDFVLARPRTKEFLFAFPALSAAIFFAARNYKQLLFPFVFASVMGMTSIINTFCHSRAPIYLSVSRTLISLAFTLVISTVVIIVLEYLNKFYVSHFGSKKI